MGKQRPASIIESNGGFVLSEGTLKTEDLLASAYRFLHGVWSHAELDNEERERVYRKLCEIADVFHHTEADEDGEDKVYALTEDIVTLLYYGQVEIIPEREGEADYLWNEEVFYFLNEEMFCGDKFYFGSQEGDGACFGFWKGEDEEPLDEDELKQYEQADEEGYMDTAYEDSEALPACRRCGREMEKNWDANGHCVRCQDELAEERSAIENEMEVE